MPENIIIETMPLLSQDLYDDDLVMVLARRACLRQLHEHKLTIEQYYDVLDALGLRQEHVTASPG